MVPRSSPWPRLSEWIVLAVCVVILAGLFLPHIHNHRPSRRIQCSNNLKNLALAAGNFENAKKRYPGYQQRFGAINGQDGKIGAWLVAIMPFLEQQLVRDLWDDPTELENWKSAAGGDAIQLERFYPAMPLLQCPDNSASQAKFAPLDYLANTGFYLLPNDAALGLEVYSGVESDSERSTISQRPANGIFNNQLPSEVIDPLTGKLVVQFLSRLIVRLDSLSPRESHDGRMRSGSASGEGL